MIENSLQAIKLEYLLSVRANLIAEETTSCHFVGL